MWSTRWISETLLAGFGFHFSEQVFDLLDVTVCGVLVHVLSQDRLRLIQLVTTTVNLSPQHFCISDSVASWKASLKDIQRDDSLNEPFLTGETERDVVLARVGLAFAVFRIDLDHLLKLRRSLDVVVP